MAIRTLFLALTLLLCLAGCKSSEDASDASGPTMSVRATNRNFVAVEIYAVTSSRRQYLGRIAPGATKTYKFSADTFAEDLSLRFQLESVDRTVNILTERIIAVPGEEIILIIPNSG